MTKVAYYLNYKVTQIEKKETLETTQNGKKQQIISTTVLTAVSEVVFDKKCQFCQLGITIKWPKI